MSATGTTRFSPEIIFVPPPPGPGMPRKRLRGPITACIAGGLVCLALVLVQGWGPWQWMMIMAPMYLVVAIIVAVSAWRVNRTHRALRRAFFEKQPSDGADPLAAALCKAWPEPDRPPKLENVRAALREVVSEDKADRAQIVCFGVADVPEVGELYFEPEVVTPTGAVWRQLIWLLIAGVLIGWCLLDFLDVLPSWLPGARPLLGGFAYFFVAGAIALAMWIWKGMIRPTYIRMAPGVIQLLEYRYSSSKPTIRSYPIEPGTLAIFARVRKHLMLTLARDDSQDVLRLTRMRRSEELIRRAWQALLSTAPTPPLSDKQLVG